MPRPQPVLPSLLTFDGQGEAFRPCSCMRPQAPAGVFTGTHKGSPHHDSGRYKTRGCARRTGAVRLAGSLCPRTAAPLPELLPTGRIPASLPSLLPGSVSPSTGLSEALDV